MDNLKKQMEASKQRAESAETERNSLAEMVQRIRNGAADSNPLEGLRGRRKSLETATQTDSSSVLSNGSANGHISKASSAADTASTETNGKLLQSSPDAHHHAFHNAVLSALSNPSFRNDRLMQSAPYASMLGVVLIGVGIMTYLNGWQKADR